MILPSVELTSDSESWASCKKPKRKQTSQVHNLRYESDVLTSSAGQSSLIAVVITVFNTVPSVPIRMTELILRCEDSPFELAERSDATVAGICDGGVANNGPSNCFTAVDPFCAATKA